MCDNFQSELPASQGLWSMLQDGVEMGLDQAVLGPADALLLGSSWELPVHWCARTSQTHAAGCRSPQSTIVRLQACNKILQHALGCSHYLPHGCLISCALLPHLHKSSGWDSSAGGCEVLCVAVA